MVKSLIQPFQKERKSNIKKVGLCYSELVTLQKLWKNANKCQKLKIAKSVTTIGQFVKKVPVEPEVSGMELFQSKKIKLGVVHTKI